MALGTESNYFLQLILASDLMTWFILIALTGMLLVCLTIFFYKLLVIRVIERQLQEGRALLREIKTFDDLKSACIALSGTVPGMVLKKNLTTVKSLLERHPDRIALSEKEIEYIEQQLEQSIDEIMQVQESYLQVLFVSASIAPLLGLFGTIWGLVHSFMRISIKQSADIATVAPGIAEALITTLAGLIAAIPALILYHIIMSKLRQIERQLITFAENFLWIIQTFFTQ